MRKLALVTGLLAAMLVPAAGFAGQEGAFRAELSGKGQEPAVETMATGAADFKASPDGKALDYKLTVEGLTDVSAAHIHLGKMGQSGPPVVTLYGGPEKSGAFSGVLKEGTITEKDLVGDLAGKPITALEELIKSGDVYVNVHTKTHPGGEIRGQIN